MKRIFLPISFSLRSTPMKYFALTVIGFIASLLVLYTDETQWWNNLFDPIIGIGTFIFALTLWYGEVVENWEKHLPKRLTIRFIFQEKLLMICKEAVLVNEADIRQWGQQVGKQMNHGKNLKFEAFFEIDQIRPKQMESGAYYKPYFLNYYLSEIPKLNPRIKTNYEQGLYLHWRQGNKGNLNAQNKLHPAILPPLTENEKL